MTSPTSPSEFVPGLAGIVAARSRIAFLDGERGLLAYRGHRVETLAAKAGFEETVWLLWHGRLPRADELARFEGELRAHRALRPETCALLGALPRDGHPLAALQTAIAALALSHPRTGATDVAERRLASQRVLAQSATILAAFARRRRGLDPVAPRADLGHAANFLWMLDGEAPSPRVARTLDAALILHAELTLNASTFTTRVAASSEADPYAAVAAGLGSLGGALHGGAAERVVEMLEEIGEPENAAPWLDAALARGRKIPGLGHRVFRVKDPRALALQGLARALFAQLGSTRHFEIAGRLEEAAAERLGPKGVHPNVDFYSGTVYLRMGIERVLFTPLFAIARVAGDLAHYDEQMNDNRLVRPRQEYLGPHDLPWIEIEDR